MSKNIDWNTVNFGKASDAEIAKRLGVSANSVQKERNARGIPAKNSFGANVDGDAKPANTDWDTVADLGTVPDSTVAKRLGVSTAAVGQARKARGIPPAKR